MKLGAAIQHLDELDPTRNIPEKIRVALSDVCDALTQWRQTVPTVLVPGLETSIQTLIVNFLVRVDQRHAGSPYEPALRAVVERPSEYSLLMTVCRIGRVMALNGLPWDVEREFGLAQTMAAQTINETAHSRYFQNRIYEAQAVLKAIIAEMLSFQGVPDDPYMKRVLLWDYDPPLSVLLDLLEEQTPDFWLSLLARQLEINVAAAWFDRLNRCKAESWGAPDALISRLRVDPAARDRFYITAQVDWDRAVRDVRLVFQRAGLLEFIRQRDPAFFAAHGPALRDAAEEIQPGDFERDGFDDLSRRLAVRVQPESEQPEFSARQVFTRATARAVQTPTKAVLSTLQAWIARRLEQPSALESTVLLRRLLGSLRQTAGQSQRVWTPPYVSQDPISLGDHWMQIFSEVRDEDLIPALMVTHCLRILTEPSIEQRTRYREETERMIVPLIRGEWATLLPEFDDWLGLAAGLIRPLPVFPLQERAMAVALLMQRTADRAPLTIQRSPNEVDLYITALDRWVRDPDIADDPAILNAFLGTWGGYAHLTAYDHMMRHLNQVSRSPLFAQILDRVALAARRAPTSQTWLLSRTAEPLGWPFIQSVLRVNRSAAHPTSLHDVLTGTADSDTMRALQVDLEISEAEQALYAITTARFQDELRLSPEVGATSPYRQKAGPPLRPYSNNLTRADVDEALWSKLMTILRWTWSGHGAFHGVTVYGTPTFEAIRSLLARDAAPGSVRHALSVAMRLGYISEVTYDDDDDDENKPHLNMRCDEAGVDAINPSVGRLDGFKPERIATPGDYVAQYRQLMTYLNGGEHAYYWDQMRKRPRYGAQSSPWVEIDLVSPSHYTRLANSLLALWVPGLVLADRAGEAEGAPPFILLFNGDPVMDMREDPSNADSVQVQTKDRESTRLNWSTVSLLDRLLADWSAHPSPTYEVRTRQRNAEQDSAPRWVGFKGLWNAPVQGLLAPFEYLGGWPGHGISSYLGIDPSHEPLDLLGTVIDPSIAQKAYRPPDRYRGPGARSAHAVSGSA